MMDYEDAFGHLLWDCFSGDWSFEITERDDGYVDASDPHSYFSSFDSWLSVQQEALKYAEGRVLDIGCGAGRHSLHLQRNGFDVIGIDNSPLAVETCRARGLMSTLPMSIDRLKFSPSSFETILMLGGNFGLFENSYKSRLILGKLNRITSNEAVLLAETFDPYKTSVPAHLAYHQSNRRKSRMGGQVRMRHRYRSYLGRWQDFLFVSKGEMAHILEGTGWTVKQFIDHNEPTYVAVIRKEA